VDFEGIRLSCDYLDAVVMVAVIYMMGSLELLCLRKGEVIYSQFGVIEVWPVMCSCHGYTVYE
jgi:hypothetical protein